MVFLLYETASTVESHRLYGAIASPNKCRDVAFQLQWQMK